MRILEYIKFNASKDKFCIHGHDTDKEIACFATKAEAQKHLKRMSAFSDTKEAIKEWDFAEALTWLETGGYKTADVVQETKTWKFFQCDQKDE